MSTWPTDTDLTARFKHPANASVLELLERDYPWSVHGDLAEELLVMAEAIPEAERYCPDISRFGYWALYTKEKIIFALAIGMQHLSLRLPGQGDAVVSDGGAPSKELGLGWYDFSVFEGDKKSTNSRIGRWLRFAFELASNEKNVV